MVSFSARAHCTSVVVASSHLKHRAHIMTMPTIHQAICQDHSGGNPAKEKAWLPRMQAGPMAKKYQIGVTDLHDPAPFLGRLGGGIDAVQEGTHLVLALDGLLVVLQAQPLAGVGHHYSR